MSSGDTDSTIIDEETPLLASGCVTSKTSRTPLPKAQLAIVLMLQICEPITSQSIYPYINAVSRTVEYQGIGSSQISFKLISELDITGGDNRKVGYYAGMIVE